MRGDLEAELKNESIKRQRATTMLYVETFQWDHVFDKPADRFKKAGYWKSFIESLDEDDFDLVFMAAEQRERRG